MKSELPVVKGCRIESLYSFSRSFLSHHRFKTCYVDVGLSEALLIGRSISEFSNQEVSPNVVSEKRFSADTYPASRKEKIMYHRGIKYL